MINAMPLVESFPQVIPPLPHRLFLKPKSAINNVIRLPDSSKNVLLLTIKQ